MMPEQMARQGCIATCWWQSQHACEVSNSTLLHTCIASQQPDLAHREHACLCKCWNRHTWCALQQRHSFRIFGDHEYARLSTQSAEGRVNPLMLRLCALQDPAAAAGGVLERSVCYGPAELRMGATVSVYGRDFLIVDCDVFTRRWLLVRRRTSPHGPAAVMAAPGSPCVGLATHNSLTVFEVHKIQALCDTALVSTIIVARPMTV